MIKFTEEMKERITNALRDQKYCLLATVSSQGEPSISLHGKAFVWDDEHLAVWEPSGQSGAQHMEGNPHVVLMYVDLAARVGWRFYGEATVCKEGEMRERIMARAAPEEVAKDPKGKGFGLLIRIDKILRYSGDEVFQQR